MSNFAPRSKMKPTNKPPKQHAIEIIHWNNTKNQYSARVARPLNVNDFLKHVETACPKLMSFILL